MFRSRQHVVALSLVASMALAGCAAPGMSVAPAAKAGKAPLVNVTGMPSMTVTHQEAARAAAPAPKSSLLVSTVEMTEDEIAEDAVSLGYDTQAVVASKLGQKFNKTGIVRSTETGFALETTKGLFKKKKDTVFTLTGTPDVLASLSKRENKKALIKGVVDKDNIVTIESVKGLADLGFLTNWFSKGKVVGSVSDAAGNGVADVRVAVKSADGFTFSALSDADGEFEIKGLTPGAYAVSLTKDGFQAITGEAITVAKLKSVKLDATMAAAPVEAPTGNGNH